MKLKDLLSVIKYDSIRLINYNTGELITSNDFGNLIDPQNHSEEYKKYYDCDVLDISINIYGLIKYICIEISVKN